MGRTALTDVLVRMGAHPVKSVETWTTYVAFGEPVKVNWNWPPVYSGALRTGPTGPLAPVRARKKLAGELALTVIERVAVAAVLVATGGQEGKLGVALVT